MVKAKRERKYQWFVEPFGADANRHIAELIGDIEFNELEIEAEQAKDGQVHRVYECSRQQMGTIESSLKIHPGMKADCWVREGNGIYRPWKPEEIQEARLRNKARRKKGEQNVFAFAEEFFS